MKKALEHLLGKRKNGERGSLLILVIIFLFLGLTVVGTLSMLGGTSLKAGIVFNNKTAALYAADAGIEDAKWQIAYDQLGGKFSTYDPHDYATTWNYSLPQVNSQPEVNNKNVNVAINNVWIPKGLLTNPNDVPSKATANSILNNTKLMVTGGAYGTNSYNIVITYYMGVGENLNVNTIGVWLPPGFTYHTGSSNLGSDPNIYSYQGGQAAVWTLNSAAFTSLPGVSQTNTPMTASISFNYDTSQTGTKPDAVSWVSTTNVSGLTYTWDDSVRVFHITSTADSTTAETYIGKNELSKNWRSFEWRLLCYRELSDEGHG